MKSFTLNGNNLSIRFIKRRNVFSNVNISVSNSEIICIAGENGSGKTTLLKVLSGILRPNSGQISFTIDDREIKQDEIASHIGFVSPYLILYEEFTPMEHLELFAKLRGIDYKREEAFELLKEFNLHKRYYDLIKTFSSGMKQRVKYMIAMQSHPEIFLLDEPFTNLDEAGIKSVTKLIEKQVASGNSIIIASNDEREKQFCSRIINLSD